jgi:hypothetical protein
MIGWVQFGILVVLILIVDHYAVIRAGAISAQLLEIRKKLEK